MTAESSTNSRSQNLVRTQVRMNTYSFRFLSLSLRSSVFFSELNILPKCKWVLVHLKYLHLIHLIHLGFVCLFVFLLFFIYYYFAFFCIQYAYGTSDLVGNNIRSFGAVSQTVFCHFKCENECVHFSLTVGMRLFLCLSSCNSVQFSKDRIANAIRPVS